MPDLSGHVVSVILGEPVLHACVVWVLLCRSSTVDAVLAGFFMDTCFQFHALLIDAPAGNLFTCVGSL